LPYLITLVYGLYFDLQSVYTLSHYFSVVCHSVPDLTRFPGFETTILKGLLRAFRLFSQWTIIKGTRLFLKSEKQYAQKSIFAPVFPQSKPEPPPPPGQREVLRLPWRNFYTRFYNVLFVLLGIAIALTAIILYDLSQPPTRTSPSATSTRLSGIPWNRSRPAAHTNLRYLKSSVLLLCVSMPRFRASRTSREAPWASAL